MSLQSTGHPTTDGPQKSTESQHKSITQEEYSQGPGLIECSLFNGAKDNQGAAFIGSWDGLKTTLAKVNHPRRNSTGDEAKRSLPAICPAKFKPGSLRARDNVLSVGLALFDFDNAGQEPTGEYWPDPRTGKPTNRPKFRKVMIVAPVGFDEVQECLWNAGVDSFTWTTWSCQPDWWKFRVVVPLATPVPLELWEAATEWIMDRLGFAPFRRGLDIPVLRNAAALGFLPGAPDPSSIRFGETQGEPLVIPLDRLTPAAVPMQLDPWQEAIKAQRQATKGAGKHWFQCYRVNGSPVDFKALDLASVLRVHGIQVGEPRPFKDGQKWRCHCPWASEHSHGLDDDAAVVIQTPGQFPSFQCRHSGHLHLALQDLIAILWGGPNE